MICMLVLNSNLKSAMLFPSSELAGFLSLDSLVRPISGSFGSVLSPFRIGGDSLFEFSGGPPF